VGREYKVAGGSSGGGSSSGTGAKVHKAASGDTPGGIAAKYGIKLADFYAWNNLDANDYLHVGREYRVSGTSTGGGAAQTHTVRSGENPTTIARRYGVKVSDVLRWNGWSKNHVLRPGDKVTIKK
jgi:membrane-bound lytic murein transglycosylase D